MAKRSRLTELGCIACKELSEFGAGKEGWLVDDPTLLSALDTHSLVIANRSLILIIDWNNNDDLDTSNSPTKIKPSLSSIEGEITAIEWLIFDDLRVICIGTSNGYLLIYSLKGYLIHKQFVHPGRILKLQVRGSNRFLRRDCSSSEEVCVVMPGVIARFDESDLQSLLQRWLRETHSDLQDQKLKKREPDDLRNSYGRIPYQLWNVSKYGSCSDAAITGMMRSELLELQSSERYYCAVTIGQDAVISAYRLSEDRNRSIVGAILSKVVPAAFSTISSVSKLIWRSDKTSTKMEEVKTQSFAKASSLTCFKDHPRKAEGLTLSPGGEYSAVADSFGRICLLHSGAAPVFMRIWKGYRHARCLFMEMLVGSDGVSSSSTYCEHSKSDYCLCLAIHAPNKGVVEVWEVPYGSRLFSIPCAKGSKILQPTPRFESSTTQTQLSFVPLEVFLLNGDSGQISVINGTLD